MALIKCLECEKDISDTAISCPHCGFSFKPKNSTYMPSTSLKKSKVGVGLFALVGILVVGGIIGIGLIVKKGFFEGNAVKKFYGTVSVEQRKVQFIKRTIYKKSHKLKPSSGGSFGWRDLGYDNPTLRIEVVERLGRNIEFEVRSEGKVIYKSGVKKRIAKGTVRVRRRNVHIFIKNGNWFVPKLVDVEIMLEAVVKH